MNLFGRFLAKFQETDADTFISRVFVGQSEWGTTPSDQMATRAICFFFVDRVFMRGTTSRIPVSCPGRAPPKDGPSQRMDSHGSEAQPY